MQVGEYISTRYRCTFQCQLYVWVHQHLCRKAAEAEKAASIAAKQAEAALKEVRLSVAEIQGQQEELSPTDLHSLADTLLQQWQLDRNTGFDRVKFPVQGFLRAHCLDSCPIVPKIDSIEKAHNWSEGYSSQPPMSPADYSTLPGFKSVLVKASRDNSLAACCS